jgi:hypothetical protein
VFFPDDRPIGEDRRARVWVIAHFAEGVRPVPRLLPDETTQQFDALVQRRCQLIEILMAERHRVALPQPTVRDRLAHNISTISSG